MGAVAVRRGMRASARARCSRRRTLRLVPTSSPWLVLVLPLPGREPGAVGDGLTRCPHAPGNLHVLGRALALAMPR
jgi:hypothetical protein